MLTTCPHCHGDGKHDGVICMLCLGDGCLGGDEDDRDTIPVPPPAPDDEGARC